MYRRTVLSAIFVCLALGMSTAQDPTKVESSHYRVSFVNEHVEVISVHYGPHEKSALHDHPGGVVVSITKAHLRFTDQNGRSQEVFSEPGEARWFPPVKHRVENLGDTPYNAVYIAIRKSSVATAKPSAPGDEAEMQKNVAEVLALLSK